MAFDTILLPCPLCKKGTAPAFMWHLNETEWMCLVCYQTHKDEITKGGRKHIRSSLHRGSKNGHYALKAMASVVGISAAFVGAVCLFYRPQAREIIAKITGQEHVVVVAKTDGAKKPDPAAQPDGKPQDAEVAQEPPTDQPGQTPSEAKPASASPNTIDATTGGKKERIAPTVEALTPELPQKALKKEIQSPEALKGLIAEGMSAAAGGGGGGGGGGPQDVGTLHPKEDIKDKAEQTKEAALTVASSIIDRNDPDGTKTAEALAKLGSVSTVFAEVASQLVPGDAGRKTSSNSSVGSASGTRLEGDVLAAQGNAGYDPLEAMRRESEGEATPTTIRVALDPKAPKQISGTAGISKAVVHPPIEVASLTGQNESAAGAMPGVVQKSGELALNSLPPEFAAYVRNHANDSVPKTPTTQTADHSSNAAAAQLDQMLVVMLNMRGDLLFDFKSAALGPEAEAQLSEVASILARYPDAPVLVRGFTDSKGTPEANRAISKKRAEAVRAWLVAKTGLPLKNMSVQGLGAAEPVAPNENPDGTDNPAGREKNRRVTVIIPQS